MATNVSSPMVERPAFDGFCYDLNRLFVPCWYEPMALGQLEALRKAGLYRSRWYAVPEDPLTLGGYDTLEQQVRIVPGSYLWGIISSAFNQVQVRIVEGSTGIPFMSDFVDGGALGFNLANFGALPWETAHPVVMTQPRYIVSPGYVQVELANTTGLEITPERLQVILLCAEPCVVVEENMEVERYIR